MAIAKVILNGETLMDVTSDTVTASNTLSGVKATKNDGTKVTGNIASKSSTDLTASGATVTAPAGYYANAASKAVATATHPNPTATIASSTGVVTASHTQGTGYVTGGTTTGTLSLTTQAGKTITPTESAQTAVASYRWTTGPVSVAAISSTYVGTGITTRSAADMTVAGQSVTAPAGYYSQAFTKAVTTTTHPNPTAAIVSSTGVVTATHTQGTGYVTSGTTTGTLNLTTQGATTYNTSTADQTIASNRWLTGTQTIKGVTTSNLTAENIAEGVVVKVGDANNASRITQITGTHSSGSTHTLTLTGSGSQSYCYIKYKNIKYYNTTNIQFHPGETITLYCRATSDTTMSVTINQTTIKDHSTGTYEQEYTLPDCDVSINIAYSTHTYLYLNSVGLDITSNGVYEVAGYGYVNVPQGSAFPPATTITKAPTFSMNSATGVITASYTGSSSITPTVTSGWVSQGTAGTISTTGTSTFNLATQGAQTITPGSTAQIIASNRWLTGVQTIAGDSNLKASNIKSGVSIFGVDGTYAVGDYYSEYKRIALNDAAIDSSHYSFSEFFGQLSIISECMFMGRQFAAGTYVFSNVNWIGSRGFAGFRQTWNTITSVHFDFPKLTSMYPQAFEGRYYLTTINMPLLTTIPSNAFSYCTSLTEVSAPLCSVIQSSAFYLCAKLSIASFPICTNISANAFDFCSKLATISFPSCTHIGNYAFRSCYSLTTASFPACISIGANTFNSCSALTTVSFPSCTNISAGAFSYCSRLSTASFPVCTSIDSYTFDHCSALTTVSFPSCTHIGAFAFQYCHSLTTASFPACISIGANAFNACSALTTVNFPSCISIDPSAFNTCSALTTVSFPVCTSIGNYAFQNCYSLTTASFPACTIIGAYAFRSCRTLLSLYLLGSSIATLSNINAFVSTPISNYTTSTGGVHGSIFVPASLYDSYRTAANWSTFSSRFVSV